MALDWPEVWHQVAQWPLSRAIAEAPWAYPALETVHLIGIALLFGPILVFDLRVLGAGRAIPPGRVGALLLPWVWTGFLLNAGSGLLLFASDAAEFAANPAFQAKMALIVIAGLNAALFQCRFGAWVRAETAEAEAVPGARGLAALSIGIWLSVLIAGRMIAYVG